MCHFQKANLLFLFCLLVFVTGILFPAPSEVESHFQESPCSQQDLELPEMDECCSLSLLGKCSGKSTLIPHTHLPTTHSPDGAIGPLARLDKSSFHFQSSDGKYVMRSHLFFICLCITTGK